MDLGTDTIAANALGPRLILTTFVGRSTWALSENARKDFETLVAAMDTPVWISDATRLTGFEPRTLTNGHRWFSAFKARGGRDCLVVSDWDKAMMAARSMALGLGIRIRNFSTFEQAKAAATKLLESA
ncbi:MAG TPA: hypothetical protein VFG30_29370 [Polyangiales bacterium]|nr:hypothetical protein [Polyangiales bacterium]